MATKTDKPTMTVSRNTQNYIDVLIMMQRLYDECHNAISAFYGDNRVDTIMNRDIFPKWQELRNEVYGHLNQSINYNCSSIGTTEI